MKNQCKHMAFLATFALFAGAQSGSALAGQEGNGGNGLLIDGKIYLVDLVEAGVEAHPYFDSSVKSDEGFRHRLESVFGAIDQAPIEKLTTKLSEIASVNRVTALSIMAAIEMYSWQTVRGPLVDVGDLDSVINYDPSQIVRLAVRRGRAIRMDRDLWSKMDEAQRAALAIHEAVYAMIPPTRTAGAENAKEQSSERAREITGFLFTSQLVANGGERLSAIVGQDLPSAMGAAAKTGTSEGKIQLDPSFDLIQYDSVFEKDRQVESFRGSLENMIQGIRRFCESTSWGLGGEPMRLTMSNRYYVLSFGTYRNKADVEMTFVDHGKWANVEKLTDEKGLPSWRYEDINSNGACTAALSSGIQANFYRLDSYFGKK